MNEYMKMADRMYDLDNQFEQLKKKNTELERENEELRNNGFTVSVMTEQQLKVALEKGEQLEKENTRLNRLSDMQDKAIVDLTETCKQRREQLTKAKEHIRTLISCLIDWVQEGDKDYCYIADAEQFLKEIEK